jgi:hypothetical protein
VPNFDPIEHNEFVIILVEVEDDFIAKIRQKDGRPFVVARAVNHEFSTMRYADAAQAIEDAKAVADSASMSPAE